MSILGGRSRPAFGQEYNEDRQTDGCGGQEENGQRGSRDTNRLEDEAQAVAQGTYLESARRSRRLLRVDVVPYRERQRQSFDQHDPSRGIGSGDTGFRSVSGRQ